MRTDIQFDYTSAEITLKRSIPQFTVIFEWEREDDYVAYGVCKINKDININLLKRGLGISVPFMSSNKRIMLSFRIVDNSGNESVIYNKRKGGEYYDLMSIRGEELMTTDLPVLSIDGIYRVVLDDDVAYLCDFNEYDFTLCESLEQNKVFLLMCNPGNLYQYPTTGVGILKYLNSNVGSSGLGNKIKEQFNMDDMYVEKANIDQEKGIITIDAREE